EMYMSPPRPLTVGVHVPAPVRSDTNINDRPRTGVGQKSAVPLRLMGARIGCGVPHGSPIFARSATQILLPSVHPSSVGEAGTGGADAMKSLSPSAVSIGQPSATSELTSGTSTAFPNEPGQLGTTNGPCAWARPAPSAHTAAAVEPA